MSNPDEQRTSFIPPNFIEKGKILNAPLTSAMPLKPLFSPC